MNTERRANPYPRSSKKAWVWEEGRCYDMQQRVQGLREVARKVQEPIVDALVIEWAEEWLALQEWLSRELWRRA